MEMSGLDGPITTSSAAASADLTSVVMEADSRPSNSIAFRTGESRSRTKYS